MSSPSITSQVPEKDILHKLNKERRYREIEWYLDSPNYAREKKIEWILYHPPKDSSQRSLLCEDRSEKSLFHAICELRCPKYIIEKVFDILGEKELSSNTCTDYFCKKTLFADLYKPSSEESKQKLIIERMMKKLSKLPEVKLELLERAISKKFFGISKKLLHYITGLELIMVERSWRASIPLKMNFFQFFLYVKEEGAQFYWNRYYYRDIKKPTVKILNMMLDKGGKELVLRTNEKGQSILHTFGYFGNEKLVPILKRIVEIGGADLLKIQDKKGTTILHRLLQQKGYIASGYWKTLGEIFDFILDNGGKELVHKTNEDGKTILNNFTYDKDFVPIVRRIVELGGESLFKIQDKNGDTILHQLFRQHYISKHSYQDPFLRSYFEEEFKIDNNEKKQILELYMNNLANNKEVVIIRNNDGKTVIDLVLESKNQPCIDVLKELTYEEFIFNQDAQEGKTVLHKACEQKMYDEIQMFLETGGKELLMKQDAQGNSAIHLLPNCCENHDRQFQCIRGIIEIGGKDLFTTKNNEGNKPPILSQIDQYTQDSQQLLQVKIEHLKKQLVLEEKRGQNEIEIVKKWHEERHEESVSVLEEKEKEVQRLQEVERSMMKVIEDQKQMIDTLQKERQQFSDDSEKKQQENDALKQDIETLKQQIASSTSEQLRDRRDIDTEEKIAKDNFEEVALFSATKKRDKVDKCKVQREQVEKVLECSICFDPFDDPHIVPECCHRFCFKCIDTAIKKSGKECPMCRKRISSKRSLRRDDLIGKISKIVFSDDKEGDENKDQHTKTTKAKSAIEIQQYQEEVTSMKEKLESQEEMLKQSDSNISQLEKHIAEKDGVITAKERENNALKQENDALKLKLSSSLSSKRSRAENESTDNDEDEIISKKRRKTIKESEATSFYMNEALESENEDLLQQLKKEKADHSKTIERLGFARKKLKDAYRTNQR
ncbi:hypothetical protein CTEN210_00930 [Chaetoceros tenuissimus]|uniref:RING-type domain-containing protein n=1 Tax=Chaetoceros tenuissimus TaxID=426638 RepID=A0AAD3CEQ9_9STRA|nr:hypothetical protein CTEN210_00930 [Chaetoceros tenuissimus]